MTNWAEGRIALVTGATSGFGDAVARQVVAAGGRVIAVGRREDRLHALRDDLGDRLHPLVLDLTDRDAIGAAVAGLPADFDEIDILFNNAGLALGLTSAQEGRIAQWREMIATNVTAVTELVHAVLPGMVARGRGDIVNMSSVAATYPYPGGNIYGATKAFVRQFSLNLRADVVGTGVRVTSVEPGMCDTEFSTVRFDGDKGAADKVYANMTPLSADDIANAVTWILQQPRHVNINAIELMPMQQAFGPFAVKRDD
ncbi:MAG: SDR family NAD(P)-dependent oxidoreductase [Sphingomonas bacterium]|nr:SDR family NAD(P)-dependent oxidoreductase [Sphingomonas bacterium]